MTLEITDPQIATLIAQEQQRQQDHIELIASENFTSDAVMQATGSVLTNKYAEGYPGKRYYGGCVFVDEVEELAKSRALELFQAKGYMVNVQPHSGSQANMAVFLAALEPGDTVLSMDLGAGGHLSHGLGVNFSGKFYKIISYGITEEGLLDYEHIRKLAVEHKPKLIIAGASAYARTIDFKAFSTIAREVNALFLADIAHVAGLVATGLHPSPFGYADFVTTTTHKTLRGPRGGVIFAKEEWEKKINSAVFPGMQGGPLMHIIAAKAVAFEEALQPSFQVYQEHIVANAKAMAEKFTELGITLVGKGTDNHLMLLDLRSLEITGKEAQAILEAFNITVNKNGIPNDPQPPWITSGIRVGTPAVTSRGFDEADCREVASLIVHVLKGERDEVKEKVAEICKRRPLYE